ncbi:MAG TPA: stage II sporulation protein R [Syntrophomonadaceae bacterium]|nr:stage II sporulation protein R [Syntrophomonadaceae bacterium]
MKRITLGIILILLISVTGWWVSSKSKPLEESVLRLHVIANSDDPRDQALKLAVKDDIVSLMQAELADLSDAQEARYRAEHDLHLIEAVAQDRIIANGYDYPVSVSIGEYDFPTKSYGNLVFPPGRYQAVRIVIGEGQGKNWWCVLFPPLCLVSSSDSGLGLTNPQQAQVSFKCLELFPRGVRMVNQ